MHDGYEKAEIEIGVDGEVQAAAARHAEVDAVVEVAAAVAVAAAAVVVVGVDTCSQMRRWTTAVAERDYADDAGIALEYL